MEITRKARPFASTPFSNSRVDIIIPFHAQYEKVSELIRSIIISVKSNPYQITLVDDCSDNREFGEAIKKEFLKSTPEGFKPQVQYLRSEVQLGFGGALKMGFEATSQPWILFMHSDCVVEDPNFMVEMGRSLLKWKKEGILVKMVSAKSNNPCGLDLAVSARPNKEGEDIVLEGETLPLFCSMCNRDMFRHIGGFIKEYPYAWYEDEELAYRMRSFGLKQGVCAKAWIRHHGESTLKYVWDNRPNSKREMEENRNRCLADIRKIRSTETSVK